MDEIKPTDSDHVIRKRRDSAFYDTEIGVWLKSVRVDTLIFCGIDTSISVESSLRDAFNLGYDVILISDATASNIEKHYQSTLENVKWILWTSYEHRRVHQIRTYLEHSVKRCAED